MAKTSLQNDGHGWLIEWYRDDDNDSGYGATPETTRWYGTREECVARMAEPAPSEGWAAVGSSPGMPPYDAATATGMYDHW